MFPAGVYWIGDLCYVMNDEWDEVCSLTIKGNDCISGEFQLSDGRRFAMYNTAWGDGEYLDQYGRSYGVDSGTIGCILLSDIRLNDDNTIEGGHIVDFVGNFSTSYHDGTISIGHVKVETDAEVLEEYEY